MKEQMTEDVMQTGMVNTGEGDVAGAVEDVKKRGFWSDNRGVGVVEVILILVVLVALVLIFKEQLGNMVTKAMEALEKSMNEVLS